MGIITSFVIIQFSGSSWSLQILIPLGLVWFLSFELFRETLFSINVFVSKAETFTGSGIRFQRTQGT